MHDNWVASFRTQQQESLPILRKSTKVLGRIRRVRFTKATERHANIRENRDPSLGKIQAKNLHERSRYALKFEDTSQEEIERQERCVRGDARRLTNNVLKFKAKDEVFFSPTNAIRNKTGGKKNCCRFWREHAHVAQERPELCQIGNRKGL